MQSFTVVLRGTLEGKVGNLLYMWQMEESAKINGCTLKGEIFVIIHR